MKLDILAIGVHPDDVELGAAGTIAKMISLGKKVGILDLTQGELGTRGTAQTRAKEAHKAAKILNISVRENLKMADGFFQDTEENLFETIKIIRKYQPEIVLTNAIEDRHPDHKRASELSSKACFLSGLIKIKTEIDGTNQNVWRPKHVYHYIQWQPINPDFVVDITGFMDVKLKACKAYETQFFNPKSKEKETPITSKNFEESITYRAQDLGRLVGVEHAEGFTSERLVAVNSLSDLI